VLADAIKSTAQTVYGTAGPEFVWRLVADGDDKRVKTILSIIEAFQNRYAPEGADGQVLRVCDRFGLVAAAGELARGFGIVPWKEGEAPESRCSAVWCWPGS
jgi:putative DNA primase/helicase